MPTVTIAPGSSIQAAIDANQAGTTFQLQDGTYLGQQFAPQSGDQFIGAADGGTILDGNGLTSSMTTNSSATDVVFSNLTTTNYQTAAQIAPIMTGAGWQLLNVTSTGNGGAGLYVGGANDLVQGGSYTNNGQIGIDGSFANGSTITGITVTGNNTANNNTSWDAGGIKITNTDGLTLSNSNVSNNIGQGIWADITCSNWTVSGNTADNNTGNGIMYEISHGQTTIDNNIVTDNSGTGIYISNSDGVTVSGNTVTVNPGNVFNSQGAAMGGGINVINNSGRGADASGTPYLAINDTVSNNTIIQDNTTAENGLWAYQGLPGNANDTFNNNTYYVANTGGTFWHFLNTDYSWSGLQQSGTFESSGADIVGQIPASPVAAAAASIANFTASANDTVVSGTDTTITDGSGNQWTITSGGQVATNGSVDPVTAGVVKLAYVNGTIWQETSGAVWYGETQPGTGWTIGGGTPTSPLPAAATGAEAVAASPNDTVVSGTTAVVTDASGNQWTITSGGQVATNGVVDPITAGVVKLAYVNGTIWQETSGNLWWGETQPNFGWTIGAGTPTSPLPAAATVAGGTEAAAAPNDTVLTGTTGAITDASGNQWSITSGGQVATNGVVDPVTAGAVKLAYVNGTIWQETSGNLWYGETQPDAGWTVGAGTATSPLPAVGSPAVAASPNDTVVSGTAGAVTDVSGNQWSITAGGQVATNGVVDPITAGVVKLAYVDGTIWQETSGNLWWGETKPDAGWTIGVGTPTSPLPAAVTIAADASSSTVSASQISVVATSGAKMLLISGSGDSVTLSGGDSTITDTGSNNTYVLPAAGNGTDSFTGTSSANIFTAGDTLDLSAALAATDWNGAASTVSNYLTVIDSAQGAVLAVAPTAGGTGVVIGTIGGATNASLADVLAHALT